MPQKYNVGDIFELKKAHPCGSAQWEIVRVGMDLRIKCLGCGHQVLIERPKFEKNIKKLIKSGEAIS